MPTIHRSREKRSVSTTWRRSYNHERPHEVLSLQPPVRRHRPCPRVFCESLPPIDYGPGDIVRKVDGDGWISFRTDRSALARRSAGSLWRCGLPVTMGPTSITVSNASAGLICERPMHQPVDLWTSQARCPQPHRRRSNISSAMGIDPKWNGVTHVPQPPVTLVSGPNSAGAAAQFSRRFPFPQLLPQETR